MGFSRDSTSFAEWYEVGPLRPLVAEKRTSDSIGATCLAVTHPAGRYSTPPTAELVIGLNLGTRPVPMRFDAGAGWAKTVLQPDGFCISAPDAGFECVIDVDDHILMTAIPTRIVERTLEGEAEDLSSALAPLLRSSQVDPFVSKTMRRIWDEMGLGGHPSKLFVEGAALALVGTLLRLMQGGHRFSILETTRLTDAIEERLGDTISVGWLAEIVGWNTNHFSPAFREHFGRSPQEYITDRRLLRARRLLQESEKSISEIANACGFSSQQYMTNVFSKRLGTTPGKYRRAPHAFVTTA